jgi:hypothetical protein
MRDHRLGLLDILLDRRVVGADARSPAIVHVLGGEVLGGIEGEEGGTELGHPVGVELAEVEVREGYERQRRASYSHLGAGRRAYERG